jgi:hypothetical protein
MKGFLSTLGLDGVQGPGLGSLSRDSRGSVTSWSEQEPRQQMKAASQLDPRRVPSEVAGGLQPLPCARPYQESGSC